MGEGFIERWSGRFVRAIMLYIFLMGIFGLLFIAVAVGIGAVDLSQRTLGIAFWTVMMLAPYGVIKARDKYPRLQVLR